MNLLPFIDKPRLMAAMAIADGDSSLLTDAERERNKPSGDINLFTQGQEVESKLKNIAPKASEDKTHHTLEFDAQDTVHG